MCRTLAVGLMLCLVQCGGTAAAKTIEDTEASTGETSGEADAPIEDVAAVEPEPEGELEEPSIALGVEDPKEKKAVRKTEAVERRAADRMAGEREASKIDSIPKLARLRDAAAGKTLEVPKGTLKHFYGVLEPLASGQPEPAEPHVVRVLHVGDSFIGQDVFPDAIRRRMQRRFGDAGPGFQLVDIHHRANIHRGIALKSAHFRTCFVRNKCLGAEHGRYGYGGHVSKGGPGASSWLEPRNADAFASGKGHVEVWYQKHPRGGTLQVELGEHHERLETRAAKTKDAWTTIPLGSEAASLKLKALSPGKVRAYGVVFETGESGVVWDSTPHTGMFANRVLAQDAEHFAQQIAHREVDLLVYNFGGNDIRRVAKGNLGRATLAEELGEAIALYRSGRPQMSCLVVSSTDHAKSAGTPVSPKHMRAVVAAQRDAALAQGCAFFDSIAVFGGPGKAEDLATGKHALVGSDLSHLSSLGRELLAEVFVAELVRNMGRAHATP